MWTLLYDATEQGTFYTNILCYFVAYALHCHISMLEHRTARQLDHF
jgi:hypothetical protein